MTISMTHLENGSKGDLKKTIADFEEALRLCPNHRGTMHSLKEARQKLASAGL